jgi:hypothetical protein
MPPSDAGFVVGADLVAFDRSNLPIYAAAPASLWGDAGHEIDRHGASLDRLFGEPGDVHLACTIAGDLQHPASETFVPPPIDDPLVLVAGLNDGLILPTMGEVDPIVSLDDHAAVTLHSGQQAHEAMPVLCDFGSEFRDLLPLTDGWYWDLDKAGWVVDHHHA